MRRPQVFGGSCIAPRVDAGGGFLPLFCVRGVEAGHFLDLVSLFTGGANGQLIGNHKFLFIGPTIQNRPLTLFTFLDSLFSTIG